MVLSLLLPKKKLVFTTIKVRKSTQAHVRLLAVAQRITVLQMTEELLHDSIARRKHLIENIAAQWDQDP